MDKLRYTQLVGLVQYRNHILFDGCDILCEIATRWWSLILTDDMSPLAQAMVWFCLATPEAVLNQSYIELLYH